MTNIERTAKVDVLKRMIADLQSQLDELENYEEERSPSVSNEPTIKWHPKYQLGMSAGNKELVFYRTKSDKIKERTVYDGQYGPYTTYVNSSAQKGFAYINLSKLYNEIFNAD